MIRKVSLVNFRKFKSLELDELSNYVILKGDNAIGKTTILESIYLFSITKSLKTNSLDELIKFNEDSFLIQIEKNYRKYQLFYKDKKKKLMIDGKGITKISDYIGSNPVVFFTPDEVSLINGTPNERRRFLNIEISQISSGYLEKLSKYNTLLKERNVILKGFKIDDVYLKVISNTLVDTALELMNLRINFINELNEIINTTHQIFEKNEVIKIEYLPSLVLSNTHSFFLSKLELDKKLQTTNFGIHRDDFKILLNGLDTKFYASQGQKRSVVLSIKISLCYLIKKYKKDFPILLLDDVFSELDIKRQNKLLEIVLNLGQTFISTTNTIVNETKLLEEFQVIKIKE